METTEIQVDGYEKVLRCRDRSSGLHALIAVHDTTLGPALGGMRMLPYSSEDEALFDVLRLSEGMTYKSACAETRSEEHTSNSSHVEISYAVFCLKKKKKKKNT